MSSLRQLFAADDVVRRWTAEKENATARLEIARMNRAMAWLLSQHDPVAKLGINRAVLAALFSFVRHGDEKRLAREIEAAEQGDGP